MRLAALDTSQERRSAEQALVGRKATDYEHQTILSYFDREIVGIDYNKSRISYLENSFTFRLVYNSDGKLERFLCGVKNGAKSIKFYYFYESNDFYVEDITQEPYRLYAEADIQSQQVQVFIRSFFRYVRKQFGQKPNWKKEWV